MKSLEAYKELVEDRPRKWSEEDVNYRKAEGKEECERCIHFFERRIDKFGVCELMRSERTDEDGVNPEWTCSFFTKDGKTFPLLAGDKPAGRVEE